ncbi:hypothetical protein CNYM01_01018 [Colletotrichum nymphaeae SA-01]|uniref:Uncharacterized protein n=1 Tax=Colletotrichum nymphaeae SA-01 TaxID=1460502 RepID=A0A135S986_9PEZI|nr:hypothetical protein CNYM01_01018 [Colletotrichum nymphaeae SA-01]
MMAIPSDQISFCRMAPVSAPSSSSSASAATCPAQSGLWTRSSKTLKSFRRH